MRPPGREKISGMQKASKIEKRLEKKVALVGRKNLQAGSYAIFFGVILKRRKSDFPRAQNHNTSQLPAHLMVILIFFCLFCFGEGFVELQEA